MNLSLNVGEACDKVKLNCAGMSVVCYTDNDKRAVLFGAFVPIYALLIL